MTDQLDPQKKASGNFDPFTPQAEKSGSVSWMWATGAQAVVTLVLVGLAKWSEGGRFEQQVYLLMLIGIVATWSLALRTIRERMLELMRYWHKASKGLLRRASQSGKHLISVKLSEKQTEKQKGLVKKAIWRMRIIAAGLTIPFIVMPMCWSLVSVVLSLRATTPQAKDFWAMSAVFTMLGTLVAAGYLHWVLLPKAEPLRVSSMKRNWPYRKRNF
jgi:hypothetical protein